MLNLTKLENLIKQHGWSKTYFSDLFGKNKGWIGDMKRGNGLPDENVLQQIADKLNTTVEYLTDKTDIKNKPTTDISDELTQDGLRIAKLVSLLSVEHQKQVEEYIELLNLKDKK